MIFAITGFGERQRETRHEAPPAVGFVYGLGEQIHQHR
jgi:hypothetical protein